MKSSRHIAITITEGRVIRDLFYNNLPDMLINQGYILDIFTPAERVNNFVQEWSRQGLKFYPLKPYLLDNKAYRALEIRKRIIKNLPFFMNYWHVIEKKYFIKPDLKVKYLLREIHADLLVVTNPLHLHEQSVFGAAEYLKIPTIGVVRSWDNLYKGLRIRPDTLAVWNPINAEEAINLIKYPREKVSIIGSPQFDPYFDPNGILTRDEFVETINLDSTKPIITLATIGNVWENNDETYMVDLLIELILQGEIPKDSQLVIRLHPASKLEYFLKYLSYDFVRLSYVTNYIPSLVWTMTREEVIWIGNLLRHSDLVISPGSTITIETAIFDTPTLVPVFHTYQPDLADMRYKNLFSTHFKNLVENDLVPIIEKSEELPLAINKALNDPSWYKKQREELVKDYIYYTDGKSTQRLANLMINLATNKNL